MTLIQRFDRPAPRRLTPAQRFRKRAPVNSLVIAWFIAITAYFGWEAFFYRGLYGRLAEWQFSAFGHYSPILTFASLILVFASPAVWLLRAQPLHAHLSRREERAILRARRVGLTLRKLLYGFSAILALASAATALWGLSQPGMTPPFRMITVGTSNDQNPARGSTMMTGHINYLRTSAFAQDLIIARRGVRFAPMEAHDIEGAPIRFFVELQPSDQKNSLPVAEPVTTKAGILMPDALPGSIVRLYQYAGFEVSNPYYVLFTNPETLRWPYYLTALQLALGALIAAIAAGIQHYHTRRIFGRNAQEIK